MIATRSAISRRTSTSARPRARCSSSCCCGAPAASSSRRATPSRSGRCCKSCSRSASSWPIAVLHFDGTIAFSDRARRRDRARDRRARAPRAHPLAAARSPNERGTFPPTAVAPSSSCRSTAATASPISRCATTSRSFFSASGKSFLAYRVIAGTAIVAGDPIGDPRERRELIARVPPGRPTEGMARRDRRRERRDAPRLRRAWLQIDLPRRRGLRAIPPSSRSTAAPSARCASRSRGWRRPATASRSSPAEVDDRHARRAPRASRRMARPLARARLHDGDGRALRLSGHGCRVRSATTRGPRSAASSSSFRLPRATATRSPRCAGGATSPNGLMEFLIVETIDWARRKR